MGTFLIAKMQTYHWRFHSEILQVIALASEDDQIIRPTFPNQQTLIVDKTEEAYNLQLLSVNC